MALNFRCEIYSAGDQTLPDEVNDQEAKKILQVKLLRNESTVFVQDLQANEAVAALRKTYDFYNDYLHWRSYDDKNSVIRGSVHYGKQHRNGGWIEQHEWIIFGDGDGPGGVYKPMTSSLALVAHELSHGLVDKAAGWSKKGAPGALGEHVCDVMGTMVKQVDKNQTASQADWTIGEDVLELNQGLVRVNATAERSMMNPGTAYDDGMIDFKYPKDQQRASMEEYYDGEEDDGGAHWNSGILNRAFYLAANAFPTEKPCEGVGMIWWAALKDPECRNVKDFESFAKLVISKAGQKVAEVKTAFQTVGIEIE